MSHDPDPIKVNIMGTSMPTGELLEFLFGPRPSEDAPEDDRWRIEASVLQSDGVEGTAAEVWPVLVSVVDDAWTVEKLEQFVDGTWRRRSIRDLLDAAGGDPL